MASSADGVKLVAVTEGGSGAIYTSTNSGLSWNQTSAPQTSYSCVASSPDGTKLVAADYYGQGVYTSTDSGETWATTPLWEFNNSVAISADGHTILASSYLLGLPGQANSGVLDYSINSGESFKQGDAPTNVNWAGVACSTNGELMVAAGQSSTNSSDPGAIYVSTDSGMNWLPTTAPALPWFCIACSADGSKITAGALGDGITIPSAVYSSTNYGVTWEENDAIQNNTNTFGASAIASSADGSKLVAADGYVLIYPPLNEYGTRPPNLTITFVAPHSVVVSWPATGSSTLQQNSSLANASWVTNTNPITTMNGTNSITITPPNGHLFFRLSEP